VVLDPGPSRHVRAPLVLASPRGVCRCPRRDMPSRVDGHTRARGARSRTRRSRVRRRRARVRTPRGRVRTRRGGHLPRAGRTRTRDGCVSPRSDTPSPREGRARMRDDRSRPRRGRARTRRGGCEPGIDQARTRDGGTSPRRGSGPRAVFARERAVLARSLAAVSLGHDEANGRGRSTRDEHAIRARPLVVGRVEPPRVGIDRREVASGRDAHRRGREEGCDVRSLRPSESPTFARDLPIGPKKITGSVTIFGSKTANSKSGSDCPSEGSKDGRHTGRGASVHRGGPPVRAEVRPRKGE
jgi:hypothetical protein